MSVSNRHWILRQRPTGMVGPEHFELREAPAKSPGPGEALVRVKLVSIDPANRAWLNPTPTYKAPVMPGEVMHAFGLGEVVTSNDPSLAPGDVVDGMLGWQEYVVLPAKQLTRRDREQPAEHLLGTLGVTGLTAYYGVLEIGRIRAGETFVVSAAAGATGSIAGQIAKIHGCRTVGIAGGAEKCAWLVNELGFDAAVDYKAGDLRKALRAACPQGIDVYFDNVGGTILETCLPAMNLRGRIVACGSLSNYNDEAPGPGPRGLPGVAVVKRLRLEGFIVLDYAETFPKAEAALVRWLKEGRLKAPVDVLEGLERLPEALVGLFRGENLGKRMVRL